MTDSIATTRPSISMHPAVPADATRPLSLDMNAPFEAQVKEWFETSEDLRGMTFTGLPGQAVAGVLTMGALEMSTGLPQKMALFAFGGKNVGMKVVGEINLDDYRHNVVRPRRSEQPQGEAYEGFTVLDAGGRGLTPMQLKELATELGCEESAVRVFDVSLGHVDLAKPAEGNPESKLDLVGTLLATGMTVQDWTGGRVLFLPPGLGPLAIVMATAIYGLGESWARTIRLNRHEDGSFHVEEIVDPQAMRQFGIHLSAKWEAGNAPVSVPRELFEEVMNFLDGEAQLLAEANDMRSGEYAQLGNKLRVLRKS